MALKSIRNFFNQKNIHILIFVQALVAMLGSLYYSNFGDPVEDIMAMTLFAGEGLTPCQLCWWARILMYPIVAISAVGIWKKDNKFIDYVLPLSALGIILEIYQYTIQMQRISGFAPCNLDVPCSTVYVRYLGFITIPFLALTAFIVITALVLWSKKINSKKNNAD